MVTNLIAYLIAVAIPALFIYAIFTFDVFSTGKRSTVLICVLWGVVGAFGLALLVNNQTSDLLVESFDYSRNDAFQVISTRTAPILEEVFKAIILIYFIQQPRFRYFVDGAIYGFAAGIGFAMSENIFYIATDSEGAALSIAVSRVLSASMMHATASAVVGISLGLSRRISQPRKALVPLAGLFFSFLVHFIYNNALFALEGRGALILIVAVGIGLGGGLLIVLFINNGLEAEKRRFEETLGIASGVSAAERKGVQKLGSEAIEEILEELGIMFGEDKVERIREVLVIQANIGILSNNLRSPASDRLKEAWQRDIDDLREKMDTIRKELGTYIMTLLRNLLEDETADWDEFSTIMAENDPTHVHQFDLFMSASKLSGTMSPEKLQQLVEKLQAISFFQNVDAIELENLSRAITIRNFTHGQTLFEQGDEGDAMYLIDRGYIDIFLQGQEDSPLRTFQQGDIVGELALLDGQTRSAGARANGPLRVMMLQRQHFLMFIQSRPKVILALLEFLSDKVRYTTHALTGDEENIAVQELEAEEQIAPLATDSIRVSPTDLGVFGRLSRALDEIEAEAEKSEPIDKRPTRAGRMTRSFGSFISGDTANTPPPPPTNSTDTSQQS